MLLIKRKSRQKKALKNEVMNLFNSIVTENKDGYVNTTLSDENKPEFKNM